MAANSESLLREMEGGNIERRLPKPVLQLSLTELASPFTPQNFVKLSSLWMSSLNICEHSLVKALAGR